MTILENFLKSKKAQNVLNNKPGEEGFSLVELVVVIAVLAILSAVAIPAFVGVRANARASAVKNGLVNGVKECFVRDTDKKSTDFADAQSFATPDAFDGYLLAEGTTEDCYSAVATAQNDGDSDFTIVMNSNTGVITRTCSNVNATGCDGEEETTTNNTTGEVTVVSTEGTW